MTALGSLGARLVRPGDPDYPRLTTGWNTRIGHRPDLVVAATGPDDVVAAVRYAADRDLPVRVQATGHGALARCEGGLLIHTGDWTGVRVDPATRTAEVVGGTRWGQVLDAIGEHGLAALSGSASFVGVIGYAIGGGAGWLARRHGLCSDRITAAELVTPDGERRWVDADHEPELWRAVRGGYGNAGVVTALRLGLVPVSEVYAGARSWPVAAAPEILPAYRQWAKTAPEHVSSAITFVQYPDAPQLPEPVRGRTVIQLRACVTDVTAPDAAALLRPLTEIPGALLDTFRVMPYREIGTVTNDPERPMPRTGHCTAVTALADPLQETLATLGRPGAPFVLLEARHVGGVTSESLPGWQAEFLIFTMAVTPDDSSRAAAAELGSRLYAAAAPYAADTLPSFVLAPPEPAQAAALVRAAYPPEHRGELAATRRRHDPASRFGGDRQLS
ncbi:MAG: FAD-binding oxidoreductase [Micromonosporaceae bacterium]